MNDHKSQQEYHYSFLFFPGIELENFNAAFYFEGFMVQQIVDATNDHFLVLDLLAFYVMPGPFRAIPSICFRSLVTSKGFVKLLMNYLILSMKLIYIFSESKAASVAQLFFF